jgi:hypothetical protein
MKFQLPSLRLSLPLISFPIQWLCIFDVISKCIIPERSSHSPSYRHSWQEHDMTCTEVSSPLAPSPYHIASTARITTPHIMTNIKKYVKSVSISSNCPNLGFSAHSNLLPFAKTYENAGIDSSHWWSIAWNITHSAWLSRSLSLSLSLLASTTPFALTETNSPFLSHAK